MLDSALSAFAAEGTTIQWHCMRAMQAGVAATGAAAAAATAMARASSSSGSQSGASGSAPLRRVSSGAAATTRSGSSALSPFVVAVSCSMRPTAQVTLLLTDLLDSHFVARLDGATVAQTVENEAGITLGEAEALRTVACCVRNEDSDSRSYFGVCAESSHDNKDAEKEGAGGGAAHSVQQGVLLLEKRFTWDGLPPTVCQIEFTVTSLSPDESRRFVRDAVLAPVLRAQHALRCVAADLLRERLRAKGAVNDAQVRQAAREAASAQPPVGPEGKALEGVVLSASESFARQLLPAVASATSTASANSWLCRVTTTMAPNPRSLASTAARMEEVALTAICDRVADRTAAMLQLQSSSGSSSSSNRSSSGAPAQHHSQVRRGRE